jgi:hypothetical protein
LGDSTKHFLTTSEQSDDKPVICARPGLGALDSIWARDFPMRTTDHHHRLTGVPSEHVRKAFARRHRLAWRRPPSQRTSRRWTRVRIRQRPEPDATTSRGRRPCVFEMRRRHEPWWSFLQSVRSGADLNPVLGLQHHARARNKLLPELRQGALGNSMTHVESSMGLPRLDDRLSSGRPPAVGDRPIE